jgi:hypothetical protein
MSEPPGVTLLNQRRTAFVLRYPRTRRRAVTRLTPYFVGRRGFTEPTREPPPQSGDRGPSSRRRMTAICAFRPAGVDAERSARIAAVEIAIRRIRAIPPEFFRSAERQFGEPDRGRFRRPRQATGESGRQPHQRAAAEQSGLWRRGAAQYRGARRRLLDRFWLSAYAYGRGATTRVSKSCPRQTSSAFRRQVKTSLPPGAIPAVGSSATCRPRPVSLVATSAWVFQSSRV